MCSVMGGSPLCVVYRDGQLVLHIQGQIVLLDLQLASKEGRAQALQIPADCSNAAGFIFYFFNCFFFGGRDMGRNMLVTFEYKVH